MLIKPTYNLVVNLLTLLNILLILNVKFKVNYIQLNKVVLVSNVIL